MTNEINQIRVRKYGNEFDKARYSYLQVYAIIFMLLATCAWFTVIYIMMSNITIDRIPYIFLFLTSSGCFLMSIAYLMMRSKMRKLDKYQEEIIDCVYDSLEMSHVHIWKQGKQLKSIENKLEKVIEHNMKLRSEVSSILYLQFRHNMCPTLEEFKTLAGTLESDIADIGLRDELYQKLQDNHITTPLAFFKAEKCLLLEGVLSDGEYYEIYKAICAQYPMIKELDRVPDLLINISDSMNNYSIS